MLFYIEWGLGLVEGLYLVQLLILASRQKLEKALRSVSGAGGTPENSWWECAARFFKS